MSYDLSTSNTRPILTLGTVVARVNGLIRPLAAFIGPLSRLATATPVCLAETLARDTKWLGDSHCGQAMDVLVRCWSTSLWLGYWINIHY